MGRSHKFRFAYVKFSYEAEATIQRTFTFRGQQFTANAPATTDPGTTRTPSTAIASAFANSASRPRAVSCVPLSR